MLHSAIMTALRYVGLAEYMYYYNVNQTHRRNRIVEQIPATLSKPLDLNLMLPLPFHLDDLVLWLNQLSSIIIRFVVRPPFTPWSAEFLEFLLPIFFCHFSEH